MTFRVCFAETTQTQRRLARDSDVAAPWAACRFYGHLAVVITVVVFALMSAITAHGQSDYRYTEADTLAAIDDVSATSGVSYRRLYSIVACESRLDPYAIGRAGERGAVQLHPRGELLTFYARGYDNPNSPYQAVQFLAERLNEGGAHAWTCA